MADIARDELVGTFKQLLASSDYSDFVITCGSDTYKVHKSVVCARSGFFKRAERFPGQEAANGKVDLPEDDPAIVKLLVQYLYEGEYEPKLKTRVNVTKKEGYHYIFPHTCKEGCLFDFKVCPYHQCGASCSNNCIGFVCKKCCPNGLLTPATSHCGASQLLLHAKMYEIGDKYDIVGLKQLSREKFLCSCHMEWDSTEFAPAVHCVFTTTPEDDKGLREVVYHTLSKHMFLLNKPEVQALLNDFNGLAVGLLNTIAGVGMDQVSFYLRN